MSALDWLLLAFIVAFAGIGYRTGTLRQVSNWAGLALARAGCKPLALILTLALARDLGFPAAKLRVSLCILCFLTLAVIGSTVVQFFAKKPLDTHAHSRPDRLVGLILGAGKGVVIGYVLLSFCLFFEAALGRLWPGAPRLLESCWAADGVRRHNFFAAISPAALARVEAVMDAARRPGPRPSLALAAVSSDASVMSLLTDDALAQAVRKRDWATLEGDPRIAALLSDPRIVGPLTDPLEGPQK